MLWNIMEKELLFSPRPFISVMGGGGKTTFLCLFASYLRSKGYSVLLSTSTKLAPPSREEYREDKYFPSFSLIKDYYPEKNEVVLFGSYDEKRDKLISPGEDEIDEIKNRYDVTIVEADGSRHRPIKYHTDRDPVIWKSTTAIVSIAGLWAIGKKTEDVAFGDPRDLVIDKEYLEEYVSSPEGLCKGMKKETRNILLFNGGDEEYEKRFPIIKEIKLPNYVKAYICSEKEGIIYETL